MSSESPQSASGQPVATLGEVDIEMADGSTITLKPTYGATTRIEKRFGSWNAAVAAVANINTEAIGYIVMQGAGTKDSDAAAMRELLWRTGTMKLTGPVIRYLRILANGGRPLDEDADTAGGEPEKNGDSVH